MTTPTTPKVKLYKKFITFPYAYVTIITALTLIVALTYPVWQSTAVATTTAPERTRDPLMWRETPTHMHPTWTLEGYDKLVDTPGAMVAVSKDEVAGLDSATGDKAWVYKGRGVKVCDAVNFNGNVAIATDNGAGCSVITVLDSATGEYVKQAEYLPGDDGHTVALTTYKDALAVVTPSHVRVLRGDLVQMTEFGGRIDNVLPDPGTPKGCSISDVAVGPISTAIAAACDEDNGSYHVRVINHKPDEASATAIDLDVNAHSTDPVTIPITTRAQVLFSTTSPRHALYAWQLDKDKEEISATDMLPNHYPLGHDDIDGIGYLWLIGNALHVRSGSEDVTQSVTMDGVVGMPMTADNTLVVPTHDGIVRWNPDNDHKEIINVDSWDPGRYFAFAGSTVATLKDGVIRAYSS